MSGDQLQPEDTLDDRGVDDILDEGIDVAGATAEEAAVHIVEDGDL